MTPGPVTEVGLRRRLLLALRAGGLVSFGLAVIAGASVLAGGQALWAAALVAIVVLASGLAITAAGQLVVDAPSEASPKRLAAVHGRAAALAGYALMAVVVGGFIVDEARGTLDPSPWLQMGLLAVVVYLAALLWFGRRR